MNAETPKKYSLQELINTGVVNLGQDPDFWFGTELSDLEKYGIYWDGERFLEYAISFDLLALVTVVGFSGNVEHETRNNNYIDRAGEDLSNGEFNTVAVKNVLKSQRISIHSLEEFLQAYRLTRELMRKNPGLLQDGLAGIGTSREPWVHRRDYRVKNREDTYDLWRYQLQVHEWLEKFVNFELQLPVLLVDKQLLRSLMPILLYDDKSFFPLQLKYVTASHPYDEAIGEIRFSGPYVGDFLRIALEHSKDVILNTPMRVVKIKAIQMIPDKDYGHSYHDFKRRYVQILEQVFGMRIRKIATLITMTLEENMNIADAVLAGGVGISGGFSAPFPEAKPFSPKDVLAYLPHFVGGKGGIHTRRDIQPQWFAAVRDQNSGRFIRPYFINRAMTSRILNELGNATAQRFDLAQFDEIY